MVPSLKILSDKQNLVRAKVLEAIGKWAEALGPEHVITYLAMQLEIENPELRLNSLNWIMEHRLEIKKAEHASMAVPLTCCLIDKDAKVRKEAEKVIIEVMPYIGSEPFQKQCSSFKPAQQQDVKAILERAKKAASAIVPEGGKSAPDMNKSIPAAKEEQKKEEQPKPTLKPKAETPAPMNPLRKQEPPKAEQKPEVV
jgi:hypothetical protein